MFRLKSPQRHAWLVARVVFALYFAIISPLRWGFYDDAFDRLLILDWLLDAFFLADFALRLLYFHEADLVDDERFLGLRVRTRAVDISHAFLRSIDFPLALLGSAPIDVLFIAYRWRAVFWVRMLRLCHLGPMHSALRHIRLYGVAVVADPLKRIILWLFGVLLLGAHVLCCGYYLLGWFNFESQVPGAAPSDCAGAAPPRPTTSWLDAAPTRKLRPCDPLSDRYLVSLYFILYSVTALGYGEVAARARASARKRVGN